jgi:hypothetical protein
MSFSQGQIITGLSNQLRIQSLNHGITELNHAFLTMPFNYTPGCNKRHGQSLTFFSVITLQETLLWISKPWFC